MRDRLALDPFTAFAERDCPAGRRIARLEAAELDQHKGVQRHQLAQQAPRRESRGIADCTLEPGIDLLGRQPEHGLAVGREAGRPAELPHPMAAVTAATLPASSVKCGCTRRALDE